MQPLILNVHNVFTQAITQDKERRQFVYDVLSYKVKDAEIIKRKLKRRGWDGRKSFYDRRKNTFLTGLLMRVIRDCKAFGVPYEVRDMRKRPPGVPGAYRLSGIEGLRDYQERVYGAALEYGRGVAQIATGGGKTETAIACADSLGCPTLFLTHRKQLLYDMARRFKTRLPHRKRDIGIIGDSVYEPRLITIATVQTFDAILRGMREVKEFLGLKMSREQIEARIKEIQGYKVVTRADEDEIKYLEKMLRVDAKSEMNVDRFKGLLDFFQKVQLLIVDEAHRLGSPQFYRPSILCTNAFYRIALTATPFMRDNAEEDMYLLGIAGPVLAKVTATELIERGILAQPFFKFFDMPDIGIAGLTKWREIYEQGIIRNETRNAVFVEQAGKLAEMKKKNLLIVQEREHGRILDQMLFKAGVRAQYIDGQNTQRERDKALKWLAQDRGDAVVTTNIFDEGVDVHEIGAVSMLAGNRSAPAVFQRTGRALRKKDDYGNFAVILDSMDFQHAKLLEHSQERVEAVKREPGFKILP